MTPSRCLQVPANALVGSNTSARKTDQTPTHIGCDMQPTPFDVGRAHLPPRVLVVASGVNEAREVRGFSLARIPIGLSAGHVREEAREELLRSDLPLIATVEPFARLQSLRKAFLLLAPFLTSKGETAYPSTNALLNAMGAS